MDRHAKLTLAVTSLSGFAVFLDTTALFVAFPDIVASFPEVKASELSWVLNAYTIVFAALLVPFGRLADRHGHRAAFLAGSTLFTTASLLCAIAPSPGLLVAARILQALGGAALVPASLALVMRATPADKVPVTLAIWGLMGAVAGAVGPTLAAALIEAGGWRWVFVINLPIGLLTVLAGRKLLAESKDATVAVPSPTGVVLVVAATALIALALVKSDEWGLTSGLTAATVVAGAVLLAIFILHQRRTTRPAIELSLFSVRNYAWGNVATLLFGIAFTAMFLSSILFLTNVWGYSVLRAGLAVAPGPALVAVLAPRMGKLAGTIGQRPLLVVGGVIYAVAGVWRLVALGAEPDYLVDYLPSMLFSGLGVALCFPQLSSVIGQALPQNRLGVGGAANQAIRQIGGTFGVALTIAFVTGATSLDDALRRFDRVWWLLIVGGIATALAALPLRTRQVASAAPSAVVEAVA